jgi:hypothetical protein
MPQYLNKISLSICLILTSYTHLFAQQTHNKQDGIYKTYQEFLDNKPSITKPFKLVIDTSINNKHHDTLYKVSTYKFFDGAKRIKNIWGLCDSGVLYANTDAGFVPLTFSGKYSFIIFNEKNRFQGISPETVVLSALDNLLSPSKKQLIYFKENGDAIIATDQAIGWLLRKDKDLVEAFNKEAKTSIQVYRKYLLAMNERYPVTQ